MDDDADDGVGKEQLVDGSLLVAARKNHKNSDLRYKNELITDVICNTPCFKHNCTVT